MAVVEPYAPCPCGSGQKYKWCCQKVEASLEKSLRLYHNNHLEAAISALDEGLRKAPGNPLLTLRKALMLIDQEKFAEARDLMEPLARSNPEHPSAQSLYLRLLAETEGPRAAVGRLQQTLSGLKPEARKAPEIVDAIEIVGSELANTGMVPAGIAHLKLAQALRPDESASSPLRSVLTSQRVSLWQKAPYRLSPVPEGLDDSKRGRFSGALEKASQGLWGPAAADFDALAREGTPEADRNLGLCRLWLGDHRGAVEALRRHTGWVGPTVDSVELETLCQIIEPMRDEDKVELLQWIWPVRDRDALLQALKGQDRVVHTGREPIDPDDPDSPEVDVFLMLDRPMPGSISEVSSPDQLPRLEGRVRLGQEIVAVEAFDDGRLERLAERFKGIAGGSITPAHPRSREVGVAEKTHLALRTEWLTPQGTTEDELKRLRNQELKRVYGEAWPETPQPYLNGRTPRQAAKDGNAELPLRAALSVIEQNPVLPDSDFDVTTLRTSLGVPPEPAYDPETVDLAEVPITRLSRIDPIRLSDDNLVKLLDLGETYALPPSIMLPVVRTLIDRPALLDSLDGGSRRVLVFAHLASFEMAQGRRDEALACLQRGRSSDPAAVKDANAVRWDTLELRLRSRVEHPSSWVPFLATLLDRYGAEGPHGQTLMLTLMNMGLIQALPHPDRPDDFVLDTRPLQMAMEQYGPRITTAEGKLGVSVAGG
ncbi:MAG TPA: tetratricopeptide repeat protein, partial [Isosphaeraceae bacterium]|nr:tetratricopeptide repeat protein [Isosphaeraceae bacterium]